MRKSEFRAWILFCVILITSIFFRIKIIHELPLGMFPNKYGLTGFDDEPAHLNYVKFILNNNKLPILKNKITDKDALLINEFEFHQPPLYYMAVAVFAKSFSLDSDISILITGRYLNFVLFLLSIIVLYKIFKLLDWNIVKNLTAISIFLLLGSSVYQFTVLGNDGLSWFLSWLIFLYVLKGPSKNYVSLIIIITLFHYTKSSILVFYPLLFFTILYEIYNKKNDKKIMLQSIVIFVLPLLLSFPWYLRNYSVYGTFFSMSTITGGSWHFVSSIQESILKILHMPYLLLFRMHFDPPKPMLSWFNIIPNFWLLFAGGYWIFGLRKIFTANYGIQLINILLISMVGAYVYYALPTGYTEGRLLYPALPAILFFMTKILFVKKLNNLFFEGWQLLFVLIVFLPSYIIAFYF